MIRSASVMARLAIGSIEAGLEFLWKPNSGRKTAATEAASEALNLFLWIMIPFESKKCMGGPPGNTKARARKINGCEW